MKRKLINTLVKVYAALSFIALCPPEGEIKYMIAWMTVAIINFTIVMPFALKKYYREDWEKLESKYLSK